MLAVRSDDLLQLHGEENGADYDLKDLIFENSRFSKIPKSKTHHDSPEELVRSSRLVHSLHAVHRSDA